jgi:molecular chaperone GrpE
MKPHPHDEASPGDGSPGPDPRGQELDALREHNLRLAADFENFRRRSRTEADARALAQKESFMEELLPVIDNLERALASGAAPAHTPFQQGVEMTLQQLRLLLRRHGVESEDCIGLPFDPLRHEAVSQRHEPGRLDHTILEVFQRGYRRGDRVVRPAKVVVNAAIDPKGDRHAR